jgi:hypothetical protein
LVLTYLDNVALAGPGTAIVAVSVSVGCLTTELLGTFRGVAQELERSGVMGSETSVFLIADIEVALFCIRRDGAGGKKRADREKDCCQK